MSISVEELQNALAALQEMLAKAETEESELPIPQATADNIEANARFSELIQAIRDAQDEITGATTNIYTKREQLLEAYIIYILLRYFINNAYLGWDQFKNMVAIYNELKNDDSELNKSMDNINNIVRSMYEVVEQDGAISDEDYSNLITEVGFLKNKIDKYLIDLGYGDLSYDYNKVDLEKGTFISPRNENSTFVRTSRLAQTSAYNIIKDEKYKAVFQAFLDGYCKKIYGTVDEPLTKKGMSFVYGNIGYAFLDDTSYLPFVPDQGVKYNPGDAVWYDDGNTIDLYLCVNTIDYKSSYSSKVTMYELFPEPLPPYFYRFSQIDIPAISTSYVTFDEPYDQFEDPTESNLDEDKRHTFLTAPNFKPEWNMSIRADAQISGNSDSLLYNERTQFLNIASSSQFMASTVTVVETVGEGDDAEEINITRNYFMNNNITGILNDTTFTERSNMTCVLYPLISVDQNNAVYYGKKYHILAFYDTYMEEWTDINFTNAYYLTLVELKNTSSIVEGDRVLECINNIVKIVYYSGIDDPVTYDIFGLNNIRTSLVLFDKSRENAVKRLRYNMVDQASNIISCFNGVSEYTPKSISNSGSGTITQNISNDVASLQGSIQAINEVATTGNSSTDITSFENYINDNITKLNLDMNKLVNAVYSQTQVLQYYIPQIENYIANQEPFMAPMNYENSKKIMDELSAKIKSNTNLAKSSSNFLRISTGIRPYIDWEAELTSERNLDDGSFNPFKPYMVDSLYQRYWLYLSTEFARKMTYADDISTDSGILTSSNYIGVDYVIAEDVLKRALNRETINGRQLTTEYIKQKEQVRTIHDRYGIYLSNTYVYDVLPNIITTMFPEFKVLNEVDITSFINLLAVPETLDLNNIYKYVDSNMDTQSDPIISIFKFTILKTFIQYGAKFLEENMMKLLDSIKNSDKTIRLLIFDMALIEILLELVSNGDTIFSKNLIKIIKTYLRMPDIRNPKGGETAEGIFKANLAKAQSTDKKILGIQRYLISAEVETNVFDCLIGSVETTNDPASFKSFLFKVEEYGSFKYNKQLVGVWNNIITSVLAVALSPLGLAGAVGYGIYKAGEWVAGKIGDWVKSDSAASTRMAMKSFGGDIASFAKDMFSSLPDWIMNLIDSGVISIKKLWQWIINAFRSGGDSSILVDEMASFMELYNKINRLDDPFTIGLTTDHDKAVIMLMVMSPDNVIEQLKDALDVDAGVTEIKSQYQNCVGLNTVNKITSDIYDKSNQLLFTDSGDIYTNGPIMLMRPMSDNSMYYLKPELDTTKRSSSAFTSVVAANKRYVELLNKWKDEHAAELASLSSSIKLQDLRNLFDHIFNVHDITENKIMYFNNIPNNSYLDYMYNVFNKYEYTYDNIKEVSPTMNVENNTIYYNEFRRELAMNIFDVYNLTQPMVDKMEYYYEDFKIFTDLFKYSNKITNEGRAVQFSASDFERLVYYVHVLMEPYYSFIKDYKTLGAASKEAFLCSELINDLFVKITAGKTKYVNILDFISLQTNAIMKFKELLISLYDYITTEDSRFIKIYN